MIDPIVLALIAKLHIPGGTAWMIQEADQIQCLSEIVYFEGRGETHQERVDIARSSMMRLTSGEFAEDMCSIVTQKKPVIQFPWAHDGKREKRASLVRSHPLEAYAWDQAVQVAVFAWASGSVPLFKHSIPDDHVFFTNCRGPIGLGSRKFIKIGNTCFSSEVPRGKARKVGPFKLRNS